MQNIKNREGVADVVASVLLIIIVIAAVGLVAVFITRTVGEPKYSPLVSCIEMQTSDIVKIERACYNANSNDVEITLKRNFAEVDISHLNFEVSSGEGGGAWVCGELCGECFVLKPGIRKTYYFNLEELKNIGEVRVGIDSCNLDSINVVDC